MKKVTQNWQNNRQYFYFACSGYLDALIEKNENVIARICRVQPLENSTRNEVIWFNCRVLNADNKLLLKNLQQHVEEGATVELQFSGLYHGAEEFQCCLTEEDPEHFLTLKAQLAKVQSYLITHHVDGSEPVATSMQ